MFYFAYQQKYDQHNITFDSQVDYMFRNCSLDPHIRNMVLRFVVTFSTVHCPHSKPPPSSKASSKEERHCPQKAELDLDSHLGPSASLDLQNPGSICAQQKERPVP
jgi:hypothetical protein